MPNIYENFRAACKRNGTTLTEVLNATGHSSGSTGTWKQGRPPKLDVVLEIADYLHISLDELVYGKEAADEIVFLLFGTDQIIQKDLPGHSGCLSGSRRFLYRDHAC